MWRGSPQYDLLVTAVTLLSQAVSGAFAPHRRVPRSGQCESLHQCHLRCLVMCQERVSSINFTVVVDGSQIHAV